MEYDKQTTEIVDALTAGERSHEKDLRLLANFLLGDSDDRTIGIIGASYCENYITDAICNALPNLTGKLRDRLLNRALQNGKARFDLAQAIGVIDGDMNGQLRILYDIRNAFAHDLTISSCDHPKIADHIGKFRHPSGSRSDMYATADNRTKLALVSYRLALEIWQRAGGPD